MNCKVLGVADAIADTPKVKPVPVPTVAEMESVNFKVQ